MIKMSFLFMFFMMFTISLPARAQQDLDCTASLEMVRKGAVLLDVRTREEFDQGHLDNALLIPFDEIERRAEEISKDKNTAIVAYCRSGRRSGIAKDTLLKLGYKNVINAGGYTDLLKCWPKK